MVERQLEVSRSRARFSNIVQEEMSRSQRDYVLRQRCGTIREELGEAAEDDEIEQHPRRVARAELFRSREGREKTAESAERHAAAIGRIPGDAHVREWLRLAWRAGPRIASTFAGFGVARQRNHYGLELVKRRIVEFSRGAPAAPHKKGPILLFIGPPGVGKTSLGRSIARAMGRRYGRIALGGVRDEAEIRGHRRTYVGALPGRIIQAMKKAGSRNPVLVLDEVDKMGVDLRGDPAAALLEVLDPEQNDSFVDHYIDVPFDLSEVMFLATANYRGNIPEALRDRMETIDVPGYTRTEKRCIAQQFAPNSSRSTRSYDRSTCCGRERLLIDHTRRHGVRKLGGSSGDCRRPRWARRRPEVQGGPNRTLVEELIGTTARPAG